MKRKKHDELIKKNLENLSVATDFLDTHLPLEIKNKCDLSSIAIESGSYIEEDLTKYCSDIVYKLKLNPEKISKKPLKPDYMYVYVLIEHQSSAEQLMPFRILKYQVGIIQKHLDNYPKSKNHIPLVVPLVFYNGIKSPYPYECDIANLFKEKELYDKIPLGKFKLIDLTTMDDDEILKHKKIALLEILAKHIQDRDFIAVHGLIIKALHIAHENMLELSIINTAISYIARAKEREDIEPLIEHIKDETSYYKGVIMSYEEYLMQTAAQATKQEIALNLLKSGIDDKTVAKATKLPAAEIEKLKKTIH